MICKRRGFKLTALGAIAALGIAIPVAAQNAAGTGLDRATSGSEKAQSGLEKAQDALSNLDVKVYLSGSQVPDLSGLQVPDLSGLQVPDLSGLQLPDLSVLQLNDLSGLQDVVNGETLVIQDSGEGSSYSSSARAYRSDSEAETDDQGRADREEELYNDGMDEIDDGNWDKAIDKFDQVIDLHGKHADGALYMKAYAENKRGQRSEALTLIAQLKKDYPTSKWVKEADALQIEVQNASGNLASPEAQSDCELKLLALNGLQQADPQKAVPILEKMLSGGTCPKLANQALFVLAQSNSPDARQAIVRVATGQANPELQYKAIQDLGLFSGRAGQDALLQIYNGSSDVNIKKRVLNAFMLSGAREQILNAAKNEKNPELRAEAIRQMGLMGDREDIWQLYQSEQDVQVKKAILQAMWLAGDRERVGQLAVNEKDHSLRMQAINDLGLMGKSSGPALMQIYSSDSDPEIKRKVINALFLAGDAHDLVELARKENDPAMKKAIISQLSIMGSKEATDYLVEILNK